MSVEKLTVDVASGRLLGAAWHPSPNHDMRPDADDICGIVVHNISLPPGEFGGNWIDDLFLNRLDPEAHPYFADIADLRVSAHLLLRRDGTLIQYVPLHMRAWHAGQSTWNGRDCCNDFTIGIELEGDDYSAFTTVQYQQLVAVTKALIAAYPKLNNEAITGHQHIAPGRKTDPGPHFDWRRLKQMLTD